MKLYENIMYMITLGIVAFSIYYFENIGFYCKTENESCVVNPEKDKIIYISYLFLVVSLGFYLKRDYLIKLIKKNKYIAVILLIISFILIYRTYLVFNYMKLLGDECNCEDYTIEYYLLKYHNYLQVFTIIFPIFLLILIIPSLIYLKKK